MEGDDIMNSNDKKNVVNKNYNNDDDRKKKTDDDDLLSTSPDSVTTNFLSSRNPRNHACWKDEREDRRGISLTEFVENIPEVLRSSSKGENNELDIDAVSNFFHRLEVSLIEDADQVELKIKKKEEEKVFIFEKDENKNYTRNLICTDNKTFTLLLLIWNPSKPHSPIHDHPCDGCWMKVLKGRIHEKRYKDVNHNNNKKSNHDDDKESTRRAMVSQLECTSDQVFEEGQDVYFISDNMGYHSIGNANGINETSITLHLYCPPFQKCTVFLDDVEEKQEKHSYYEEGEEKSYRRSTCCFNLN